jgi:hypothetical protein
MSSTSGAISKSSAKPLTAFQKFKLRILAENEAFQERTDRQIARSELERGELDAMRGGLDKEEDSDSDDDDTPCRQQRRRRLHGSAHRA